MKKKYVCKANAWLVYWKEVKNKKAVDFREWFSSEKLADEFITNKKDENKRENNWNIKKEI